MWGRADYVVRLHQSLGPMRVQDTQQRVEECITYGVAQVLFVVCVPKRINKILEFFKKFVEFDRFSPGWISSS